MRSHPSLIDRVGESAPGNARTPAREASVQPASPHRAYERIPTQPNLSSSDEVACADHPIPTVVGNQVSAAASGPSRPDGNPSRSTVPTIAPQRAISGDEFQSGNRSVPASRSTELTELTKCHSGPGEHPAGRPELSTPNMKGVSQMSESVKLMVNEALSEPRENSSVGDGTLSPDECSRISTPVMSSPDRAPRVCSSPSEFTELPMTIPPPLPRATDEKSLTLADLLAVLNQRTDIDPTRLRDYRSSVARMCKLLGADPGRVPLDFSVIRARLAGVNPIAKGIKLKSLENIRSTFIAAVNASGLKQGIVVPRSKAKLPPAWESFFAELTQHRFRRGLRRLARFCGRNGIDPNKVDDQVILALVAEVGQTSLRVNQQQICRYATIIWNEAVDRLPSLNLQRVTVPPSQRRFTRITPDNFTESFRKDTDAYLAWCAVDDPYAENARRKLMAPRTITGIGVYINAAATALVKSGTDISAIGGLGDLVSKEAFRSILRFRQAAVGDQENRYNFRVAGVLLQIARDWVRLEREAVADLKRIASRLPGQLTGRMTEKNKKRLRQFDDPIVKDRLLRAPVHAWREVLNEPKANWRTLARAEAAIAVACLTYMPIRLQNLTGLAYEKHLFLRSEPGAKSTLEIPAEEVKNRLPLAFDVPPIVAKMLIEFRDVLAPKILGYTPSHVFVNRDGTVKKGPGLRELIQGFMKRRVGIEFNPHTFRHLAGKLILDREPGGHEVVRQLLGHTTTQHTVTFYTGIDTVRAGRHHHRLLEQAMEERSKPVRRKRGNVRRSDGKE